MFQASRISVAASVPTNLKPTDRICLFMHYSSIVFAIAFVANLAPSQVLQAKDLTILQPRPYAVTQRQDFEAKRSHVNNPGGPELGFGNVLVQFKVLSEEPNLIWEYRVEALSNAYGKSQRWRRLAVEQNSGLCTGIAEVAAGGWYCLELRGQVNDKTVASGSIQPFGIGEIFLIAGQSYAAGENDVLLQITDPEDRVVALDLNQLSWKVADDPLPGVGDGGTIWPAMGNALLPLVRVPIGYVNVAVSGTSSRQWLPGTPLFERLNEAGKQVGEFRMVLWQQGESDVLEGTTTQEYVDNIVKVKQQLDKEWRKNSTWMLAKSTYHPTVYDKPAEEDQIRSAIDLLCDLPGFQHGPDTDILGGENRGGLQSRRHFSEVGQYRAGLMWFASIWNELQTLNVD